MTFRFLRLRYVSILLLCLFLPEIASCISNREAVKPSDLIRIGWQTTWATQGQIVESLKHTNVLEHNRLQAKFIGATYGAPLNEAALAGEVDVIFTADQPAVTLLSRTGDWVIIGRLMFNRVGLYVPPESPIQTISDLKGTTVAMPFGAAAQRVALKAIQEVGIDPATEIKAINLDITEQASVIQQGTTSKWGDIDAMAGFDPTFAMFEVNGKVRVLHSETVTSVIVMSRRFIKEHPGATEHFLSSFIEAYLYYANNPKQANEWFRQESQLTFSDQVLALAASVEPNLQAKKITDIDITIPGNLIERMQEAADFAFNNKLIRNPVKVKDSIDLSYLQNVKKVIDSKTYNPSEIHATDK